MIERETGEQLKQILQASKLERLSPTEKDAIQYNIRQFMAKHPIQPQQTGVLAWFTSVQKVYAMPVVRSVSLAALVILIGGGGIAFAAQNALPGDALYPVKTGMTEKVLAFTLFSDQAKAEYDIDLAQLRLQETETVAAQNKLNGQTGAKVQVLFNAHVEKIQTRIDAISAKQDDQVAVELNSKLEALLKAHTKIIDNLAGDLQDDNAAAAKKISADVKTKTDQVIKNRQKNEATFAAQVSQKAQINAENKMEKAEAAVKEANTLLGKDAVKITDISRQKAKVDLEIAAENITAGKAKMELKEYKAAFILFQDALRQAQEVSIYLKNESRLKIKFNLPAALVVPVHQDTQEDVEDNIKVEGNLLK